MVNARRGTPRRRGGAKPLFSDSPGSGLRSSCSWRAQARDPQEDRRAELADAVLLTADRRLQKATGPRCRIEVLA